MSNKTEEMLESLAIMDEEYERERELEWLRENEWVEEQIASDEAGYVPISAGDGEYTILEDE